MSFDGVITGAIAEEIKSRILGGKIEKIYQPENDELVFHIHAKATGHRLYASCNSSHPRIHFIREIPENPSSPLAFCMLLRKHLQSGRILDVRQKDSERIIEIRVETRNELGFSVNKRLIIEIMGKHSNIILVDDESEKIIDSIKRISIDVNRYRQILPGKLYQIPPEQDKIPFRSLSQSDLEKILTPDGTGMTGELHLNEENLPRLLMSAIQGISLSLAESIAASAMADPDFDQNPAMVLFERFHNLILAIEEGSGVPTVHVLNGEKPLDFHIIPLMPDSPEISALTFDSLSEALEYFYAHRDSSNRAKQKATDLEKNVKNILQKLYLKKQRLSEDLLEAENSEKYRLFGELLTASLHLVRPGESSVKVINYYDGEELQIPLDKRLSPSKNAQQYFKKYGKAKTAVREKRVQLEELETDILYVESVAEFLEKASTPEEMELLRTELADNGYMKKRKAVGKPAKIKTKPYEYKSVEGLRILAGRNNTDNDQLTFKLAGPKDIWFHAKDLAGSHVILFTEGREPSDESIRLAASIAAYHSKGKNSENVPVDYTRVKFVKKPKGAKPGMVIFTDNKTIYVNPLLPL